LLVFRFGLTAHSPCFRISRRTRRRPIEIPSRNSATCSRGCRSLIIGENPVEPFQKLELLRSYRPRPVIKAAARNPEQRALPAYGQPRFGRNHRPPLSTREMAGCPGKKIALDRQLADLAVQIVDYLLRIHARRRLAAARKQLPARFTSSCFQLLIIVG
jgi:hypothetical protein